MSSWFHQGIHTEEVKEVVEQTKIRGRRMNVELNGQQTDIVVLWTMLRWEVCLAHYLLRKIIYDMPEMIAGVERTLQNLPRQTELVHVEMLNGRKVLLRWDEGVRALVKDAETVAKKQRCRHVGTEHLLEALVASEGMAARILSRYGATSARIWIELERLTGRLLGDCPD